MNPASIGEMPPSTRVIAGFSRPIASAARIVMFAKRLQSGSSSGSQCDLLLGSFQIIAASIMELSFRRIYRAAAGRIAGSAAEIDLLLGMQNDFETGAAQHRFGAGPVRYPPVG